MLPHSQKTLCLQNKPVVGIISGFDSNTGIQIISELAKANPHLAFFAYDSVLANRYRNAPSNVVIFNANDENTRAVLPIFFQALDLVLFSSYSGNSSLVGSGGNGIRHSCGCNVTIRDAF